jgi:prophage maintenance system killer protein
MEQQIEIFKTKDNQAEVKVRFEQETVWLDAHMIASLFTVNRPAIVKHIQNIYKSEELLEVSTCSILEQVAADGKLRKMKLYNLDMILSVGYRVNSKSATQFRQWATQRLKDYLVNGYTLNEKRLKELNYKYSDLQQAIKLAANAGNIESLTSTEAKGILGVIEQYAYALETLDKYDHQQLTIDSALTEELVRKLNYKEAIQQIIIWRDFQKAGNLFGNEKDQSFKSSLETIYQTFDGVDLYPTIEEKAANLLYFVVKNHSFSDGNKRIAAGLFVYFLDLNNKLLNALGNKRIGDNALVAITIMIAESKSEEKDIMVKLVVNLINNKN